MTSRFSILPHPRFVELKPALAERLGQLQGSLRPDNFADWLDPLMREVVQQAFHEAGAHEGTLWLLDESERCLVPAFNTGPAASRIVGQFQQPLDDGLIGMVFASEQPFVENEVYNNARQSKLLDETLGVQTCALIAVPLHFLHGCRGVVSCVQLRLRGETANPPGFSPVHLAAVERMVAVLSRLLDFQMLASTIGWRG